MRPPILVIAAALGLLAGCATGAEKARGPVPEAREPVPEAREPVPAVPERPTPTELGISPGTLVLTEPPDQVDADLDAMAAAGARWVRVDVAWSGIEPEPGRFDWAATDHAVLGALDRGMRVLGLLAYTPAWARPAGSSDKHPPEDPQRFASFARLAVERYAPVGVRAWEVWNEPNISAFWEPRPDASEYRSLLGATAAAVRAADATAVIVTGGLSPAADRDDGRGIAPVTFLRALYEAGAAGDFDAVGMHPYSYPLHPADPVDGNHFATVTPQLHELMAANGDGDTPIWATEFGAPTGRHHQAVSADDQAAHLADAVDLWRSWEWTGPLFVYSWRDRGTDPADREDNFGLLTRDGMPKAAFGVFQRLATDPG